MTDVVSAMQIAFNVSSAAVEKPDYHLWNLPNGYILWVKKLDSSDLLDNPFNAYSSADIGTIRVAVEQEIH